jgi:hypothetical protein
MEPDPTEGCIGSPNALETSRKLEKVCRLCRKKRRGTSAVEFALVAPWFFMLVLGMVEFGRAVMVQQIITNASREGARVAVLDGTSTTEVTTKVSDYLENAGIEGADITVNPNPPNTAEYGDPVTVSVSIGFGEVSWVPLPKIPWTNIDLKAKTLSASTVMRRETIQ